MGTPGKYQDILVGGSGFIGTALSQALSERGESVFSIVRQKSLALPEGVAEEILDIRDEKALWEKFPEGESVFILVGQNSADFDAQAELKNLENLISVLNKKLPKKVLYLSSALVYGERESPAKENDPLVPVDVYSQFKKDAESLLKETLDPSIALGILRLANVYGNPMNRGFIGFVMKTLFSEKEERITVNGDGRQERDYIFIDDVVSGLLSVKDGLSESDTVNIATGEKHSLLQLIEEVSRAASREIPYTVSGKETVEVHKSAVSNEKLKKRYGFAPQYSFAAGLEETLRRYSPN